jgi:3-deoxy-D-manno-octulosonate 8-phosphate phosphatase (KDO 8-P phosphatase)
MKKDIEEKFRNIKMLILDVDGVLTDGTIIYNSEGKELIMFDVYDGFGITRAIQNGINIGIITGRTSEAVKNRAIDLGIKDFFEGAIDKIKPYEIIKEEHKLIDDEIAYVGDDILDIPLLQRVGLPIATKNARKEAKRFAEYITRNSGGNGAVREIIDFMLELQGKIITNK